MPQRQPRRQPRAARRQQGAPRDARRDREADAALLLGRHGAGDHLLDIVGIVHRLDPVARHFGGAVDLVGGAPLVERQHHQAVFVVEHARARCAGRDIIGMVDDMQHDTLLNAPGLDLSHGARPKDGRPAQELPVTVPFVRPDVALFLQYLNALPGPKVHEVGAVAARKMTSAMRGVADLETGPLAVMRDVTMPGPAGGEIALRLFDARETREPGPVLVFFHGGGWVLGDLDSYEPLCAEIARVLDLPVVSVDYRLAPEHPWPAGPDDAEAAARWVAPAPASARPARRPRWCSPATARAATWPSSPRSRCATSPRRCR